MTTEILANGLTAQQWVKLLECDEARKANKALQFFDGNQEEEMIRFLSDPNKGRKQWQSRGFVPRTWNITKMIVEKSGMLFKDKPPKLEVFVGTDNTEDEEQTKRLADELYKTEWIETFTNLDQIVRLLKTGLILIQWNQEENQLIFDILTRANAQVIVNPATRAIDSMIYRTSSYEETETFRIITKESFIDLMKKKEQVAVVAVNPNPYGIVPVCVFYDTNIPRSGFWNAPSYDIIGMNEIININLTDSEWAISFAKRSQLYTNMKIQNDSGIETFEDRIVYGHALPVQVPVEQGIISGPDKAIMLDSAGVESPFVKFLTPDVNIEPLDNVIQSWLRAIAESWSVKLSTSDNARATSGFQVLVESIDNLDLRKSRQRMFENGFKRFWKVVVKVMNTVKPGYFNENAELFVDFPEPYMPVDQKAQEEVWSLRISEDRASRIDYLVETLGLDRKEAENKLKQIYADKKLEQQLASQIVPEPVTPEDETVDASADNNVEPDDK